jgi:Protein of unknown function (DUF3180)
VSPVRRRDLAVLVLGLAVATWLLVRAWYGELPRLHWWMPTPLGVLAIAEALGARTLRARLRAERAARRAVRGPREGHQPGRAAAPPPAAPVRPVEPMLVARLAVLAQASAYVGAVFAGLWAGVLVYTGPQVNRLQEARGDSVTALVGVACAVALLAAALWLESVCRVPPGGEDDHPGPAPHA